VRALVVNGSPKGDKGNTALILDPFVDGMKEAGAEVETILVKDLEIRPCLGDYACWHRTPGRCIHDDSMAAILPKLASSGIIVFATPVYVDGVTGPLKCFMDRMIPLVSPKFEFREGHCRHPGNPGSVKGKMVLVSNCGFWEMDNFDPLIVHMKAVCRNMDREFAGALLRPHGPAFEAMLKMGHAVGDVLDAAREAGRQLARDGAMKPETLAAAGRELLPLEMYAKIVNENVRG
jgi:multimeric flavodoxin WrbA